MQRVFIEANKSYLLEGKGSTLIGNSPCKANKIRVYWEEFSTIFAANTIPITKKQESPKAA